jgi:large subunit ribosomal protein L39e
MGSVKDKSKKNRLIKDRKQAAPVPTWVVIKTNRNVRFNPKQRDWRRQKLKRK